MKRRIFAAMLAALLLPGCGTAGGDPGSASSSQEAPEAPIVIETLALELPAGATPRRPRAPRTPCRRPWRPWAWRSGRWR